MSDNPVLLVTGGASGIGQAVACLFAERGHTVVIADIDVQKGLAVVDELRLRGHRATFQQTDIRDEHSVRNLFVSVSSQFPRLDCLCNNAGIERFAQAQDYTLEDFNSITETNLRGPFLCTRQAFPLLRPTKGSIVNIASIQEIATERNLSVLAATKAGLLGWTRAVALDFASHGIRVNAVCPGAIQTPMMDAALVNESDRGKILADMSSRIPLQRIGQPGDVAEVVYFLASSAAAYITGASIVVDGSPRQTCPMNHPPRHRLQYFFGLVAVNLLWAAHYPAYKIASDHMGVATLNFWVLLLSSAMLAPLVIQRRSAVPRGARVWFQFALLGLLGILPPSVLLAWGVAHSTGANAAILSMTIPVLISIMGVLMLKEKLTLIRIVSLVLAFAGTILISRSDLAGSSFRSDLLLGNAVILVAGAGSAFYNAYSKKLLETFSETEVLLYGYLVSVVACAFIARITGEHAFYDVRAFPLAAWLAVACLGVLSWGVAMILWMWVLKHIEVSQASVSIYMLSIFGVVLSAVTLHERLRFVQILGGLVVVVATLLATEFDHRLNHRKKDLTADELAL